MGRSASVAPSCVARAKAKRRCSKGKPACLECWSRNIECQWPRPKLKDFVLLEENDANNSQQPGLSQVSVRTQTLPEELLDLRILPLQSFTTEWFEGAPEKPLTSIKPWWFASPETWLFDHPTTFITTRRRSDDDLSHIMATIFSWLAQWVNGDSNPFIHRQLYQHRFPQCIQDAYMALSCYLTRKPGNEQAILHIIQQRAQQLVAEDPLPVTPSAKAPSITPHDLDPLLELARIQSLLIYQLIGLYDGDIRLRSIAERHIPILISWMHRLVDYGRRCDALGHFLVPSPSGNEGAEEESWETLIWYSWVLAESLRRTWLVVSAVSGVYLSTRDGVVRCLGGMMFTSRKGFWDASTAEEWQQRCCDVYGGLIRLNEADKLFATVPPDDLDDFALLILEVTFGSEQLKRWGIVTTRLDQ